MFGSLISDTDEFFDDLQSHRANESSPAFSPTPPFRTNSANRKPKMSVNLGEPSTSKAAQQLLELEKRLATDNKEKE